MEQRLRLGEALAMVSALAMLVAHYLVFIYAPREAVMGDVQRIFYFHVSSAWVGFFAFFVTLISSAGYLRTHRRRWDIVAFSSVEVGLTFTLMATVSGSLWAKPTWNAWYPWQQEPRLILISVLVLLYLAYLTLRAMILDEEQRARFSAVYGILAFASVPLTFLSIRWWQRLHPVLFTPGESNLTPAMLNTLFFSLLTFTVLYFTLLLYRANLAMLSDEMENLRQRFGAGTGGAR